MKNIEKHNNTDESIETSKSTSESTYRSTYRSATAYKLMITGFIGIVLIFVSLSGVLLASVYTGNKNTLDEIEQSHQSDKNVNDPQQHQESQHHNTDINKPVLTTGNKEESRHLSDATGQNKIDKDKQDKLNAITEETEEDKIPGKTKYNFDKPVDALAEYSGPVRHIFFHPLIAYPELAFDGDYMAQGFDDWFITVKEFKKILISLHNKNYILVDINYIYEEKEEEGKKTIVKKNMLLPEGKKPLIISIDDNNYYEYMRQNGVVHKLILDSNGNIADFSITPEGKEIISRDNDIITILDKFVEEHPDFSFQGAKGIIGLTGYEGILGYRTDNPPAPNVEEEKKEALKIVKRLKDTGWSFACHGYGHLDAAKISYETLKKDTQRWKDEVEPLIGKTPVYIYPFGSSLLSKDQKFQYLLDEGFNILCAVGNSDYIEYGPNYIAQDRVHIDGVAFRDRMSILSEMFDIDEIIDDARR
ncbi:MAG TPA: polysaccharide deacetylase family protein [Clostridiales bacterium]|nr:polysaccharide deacetylase family protein [Clostridiales bacterium]